jgi:UDP-GlcNAc:undecaprenyl-phosphate GlcNAc-1-phosphate transferase
MYTAISHSLKYIGAFALGLIFCLMLTPLVRKWARQLGMMDQPDARRIHAVPTPRGGGLAILLSFHAVMALMIYFGLDHYTMSLTPAWWLVFLQASAVLAIIGFMDDKFGLSAWLKLAGQIFAATLMYMNGFGVEHVFGLDVPEWVDYGATLVWFVLLTNAFNLIDGLDGLASGLALIAALGLAGSLLLRGMPGDTLPLLILAGACLGFLRYNFNPASVFLGDTGSLFLGFALASMSLVSSSKGTLVTTLAVPLLAMGIPLYDTLLAVWRRSVRAFLPPGVERTVGRMQVMQADKDHLHHRFLALGFSQRRVAVLLYTLNVVLVVVALLVTGLKSRSTGIFLLALVAWAYVMFRHLSRIEVWETGRLFVAGFSRPKHRSVVIAIYGLWDIASAAAAWTLTFLETGMGGRTLWLQTFVLMAAPLILFLLIGQTYERIWSRARLREYMLLILLIVAGSLTGVALQILLGQPVDRQTSYIQFALFTPVVALLIMGIRVLLRLVKEFMYELEMSRAMRSADAERLVAYGAGGRFQLFLREHLLHVGEPGPKRVIAGVMDDDPNLRGCRVSGVPVLGNEALLASAIRAHRIATVMITALLPEEKKRRIAAIAREAGAATKEWRYDEVDLG